MRDLRDLTTMELPTIEPSPPKPVRSTIAQRMAAVVYQGPKEVRACRNCRHRMGDGEYARCGAHDFPVQLAGLCADHEE